MAATYSERAVMVVAKEKNERVNNICCVCLKVITVQCFKNSGVCCCHCQKIRDDDLEPWQGMVPHG